MEANELAEVRRIAALAERIGRLLDTGAHGSGLLPVHWEVLRYLDRANRFSRSPVALTAYLGSTKSTVSQTVKTLEQKGLVRIRVEPGDRRRRRLSLTALGRQRLAHDPLSRLTDAVHQLPRAARLSLAAGLEQVLYARLDSEKRRPFGQCRDCRFFASDHPEGRPYFCTLLKAQLTRDDSAAICHEQVPH